MSISYSQINTFNTCPLMYKYQYIDKIQAEKTEPMRVGIALHEAIEHYVKSRIEDKSSDTKDAWLFLETVLNLHNLRIYANELHEIFDNFVSAFEIDLDNLEGVEHKVIIPFETIRDDVVCIFDLLYYDRKKNIAKIIDFKTGNFFVKDTLQAQVYAWACMRLLPVDFVEVEYNYIRFSYTDNYVYTAEDSLVIDKYITDKYKQINTSSFEPRFGKHCFSCPYASMCPQIAKREGTISTPRSKEEAVKLGEAYLRAIIYAEQLKNMLAQYCKDVGNIVAGDKEVGYFTSESVDYDVHKFIKKAEERQLDPYEFLTIKKQKLRKYKDEFTDCIVKIKRSSKWGIRNHKEVG